MRARPSGPAPGPIILRCLVILLACAPAAVADGPTVGMPARIDQLVLPGPELEAKPLEGRGTPVVVRIAGVYPHGTAFRYDLVYYGLEPGTFDLKDYLRRKDGSSTADLPRIPVTVRALLPPGQVEPHRPERRPPPRLGGYRMLLWLGGLAWAAGLVAIVLAGRRRRAGAMAEADRPATLADRLRPLVERAVAGDLGEGQHAELERLLIGYWRRRLGLEDADPAAGDRGDATSTRRRALCSGSSRTWLHRPGEAGRVDVAALLAPYRDIPADAFEGTPEASGRPS